MGKTMLATMGREGAGHTGVCAASCNCRRGSPASVSSETLRTINEAVARAAEAVSGLRSSPPPQPTLAQQVEAELREHPDLVASVDEEAGVVNTFLVPSPPWPVRILSAEERDALERERKQLIQSLPTMPWVERTRAQTRINKIEQELRGDRSNEDAVRRKAERDEERGRERSGRYDGN